MLYLPSQITYWESWPFPTTTKAEVLIFSTCFKLQVHSKEQQENDDPTLLRLSNGSLKATSFPSALSSQPENVTSLSLLRLCCCLSIFSFFFKTELVANKDEINVPGKHLFSLFFHLKKKAARVTGFRGKHILQSPLSFCDIDNVLCQASWCQCYNKDYIWMCMGSIIIRGSLCSMYAQRRRKYGGVDSYSP